MVSQVSFEGVELAAHLARMHSLGSDGSGPGNSVDIMNMTTRPSLDTLIPSPEQLRATLRNGAMARQKPKTKKGFFRWLG